jgi:hypothetical protein
VALIRREPEAQLQVVIPVVYDVKCGPRLHAQRHLLVVWCVVVSTPQRPSC